MEKPEFIAEAKKRGYKEPEIQEILEIQDQSVREGYPINFEFFFKMEPTIGPDEIDEFYTGPPSQ